MRLSLANACGIAARRSARSAPNARAFLACCTRGTKRSAPAPAPIARLSRRPAPPPRDARPPRTTCRLDRSNVVRGRGCRALRAPTRLPSAQHARGSAALVVAPRSGRPCRPSTPSPPPHIPQPTMTPHTHTHTHTAASASGCPARRLRASARARRTDEHRSLCALAGRLDLLDQPRDEPPALVQPIAAHGSQRPQAGRQAGSPPRRLLDPNPSLDELLRLFRGCRIIN